MRQSSTPLNGLKSVSNSASATPDSVATLSIDSLPPPQRSFYAEEPAWLPHVAGHPPMRMASLGRIDHVDRMSGLARVEAAGSTSRIDATDHVAVLDGVEPSLRSKSAMSYHENPLLFSDEQEVTKQLQAVHIRKVSGMLAFKALVVKMF